MAFNKPSPYGGMSVMKHKDRILTTKLAEQSHQLEDEADILHEFYEAAQMTPQEEAINIVKHELGPAITAYLIGNTEFYKNFSTDGILKINSNLLQDTIQDKTEEENNKKIFTHLTRALGINLEPGAAPQFDHNFISRVLNERLSDDGFKITETGRLGRILKVALPNFMDAVTHTRGKPDEPFINEIISTQIFNILKINSFFRLLNDNYMIHGDPIYQILENLHISYTRPSTESARAILRLSKDEAFMKLITSKTPLFKEKRNIQNLNYVFNQEITVLLHGAIYTFAQSLQNPLDSYKEMVALNTLQIDRTSLKEKILSVRSNIEAHQDYLNDEYEGLTRHEDAFYSLIIKFYNIDKIREYESHAKKHKLHLENSELYDKHTDAEFMKFIDYELAKVDLPGNSKI